VEQYLDSTRRHNATKKDIKIISTCDPYGARCGSFGGTLAAVELMGEKTDGDEVDVETVLCLHAGGDSSRCPLSMILGKAWTNFPSSKYRNPIEWLISQLEDMFYRARMPAGSLLVIATDCLILMGEPGDAIDSTMTGEFENLDPYTVMGVAVPAELSKAKNHGVFIMPEKFLPHLAPKDEEGDHDLSVSSNTFQVGIPTDVWQKPSIDKLLTNSTTETVIKEDGAVPPTCFEVPQRPGKQAWIDSGIVIFYPKAFQTLTNLSKGLLAMCTRNGLEAAYQASLAATGEATAESLQSFARANALKVDLYTDILHNLPLTDKADVFENNDSNDVKAALRKILSVMSLKVLLDSEGTFLHVGTTQELIELITVGSNRNVCTAPRKIPTVMDPQLTKSWGRGLHLNPRFETLQLPLHKDGDDATNLSNVTLYSAFPSITDQIQVGAYSFVEYCDLRGYESVSIGDHCMLSGWRKLSGDAKEKSLRIPDALSIQLLPLASRAESGTSGEVDQVREEWVIMALGSSDAVKSPLGETHIYGVPFLDFVHGTGISLDQIGFQDELGENDCLWTAKIHPIVSTIRNTDDEPSVSFSSLFGWLEKLRAGESNISSDESLSNWISAERVSLKTIHSLADASKARNYRVGLEGEISSIHRKRHMDEIFTRVKERCQNIPCDLHWLMDIKKYETAMDTMCELVKGLEDLALEEFANGNFDISGRALMLASVSVAEVLDGLMPDDDTKTEKPLTEMSNLCEELILKLRRLSSQSASGGEENTIMKEVFECRRSLPNTWNSMSLCSKVLERLALCMIEFTISAGLRTCLDPVNGSNVSMQRKGSIIRDKFVLSVAPVRVDLAGAWSDTPPVTYEHGGSVTGMAVLVDNKFPLSCRCRLISGGTGILLKSELRDISSGSLLTSKEEEVTNISQLKDFRDPSANCALLKVALVVLGMVTEEQIHQSHDIQKLINNFCSSLDNVRLEVVSTSLLGLGTGMGTSSILGACVLQNLATCVGIGKLDDELLIHAVLMLEQLLSSGGGWQDQAHGIVGGVKTVVSSSKIPLQIKIDPVDASHLDIPSFEDRLLFAYTGRTRLAKNILQQVLRRWARRTSEVVDTVDKLVKCSSDVRKAFENGSWNSLGEYMYQSHKLKCVMAGESSGAEPESVKLFVSELMTRGKIKGAMLCGAGGGGFLMLLMSENVDRKNIESTFEKSILPQNDEFKDFSFHDCRIAQTGLTSSVINEESIDANTYSLSWQSSTSRTGTANGTEDVVMKGVAIKSKTENSEDAQFVCNKKVKLSHPISDEDSLGR